MKTSKGVGLLLYVFLTSAQTKMNGDLNAPASLTPDTQWTGGWVGPRMGPNTALAKRKTSFMCSILCIKVNLSFMHKPTNAYL
jgi:hypothetical protein